MEGLWIGVTRKQLVCGPCWSYSYNPKSKLLTGGYIGYPIGDHHRGY